MNNINSSNDTNTEYVRNIIINKKDKKGNKKRQINFLTDHSNQNIGINILKDDYDIKIENKSENLEPELEDNYDENVSSEIETVEYNKPELLEISNSTSHNIIDLPNQSETQIIEENNATSDLVAETGIVNVNTEENNATSDLVTETGIVNVNTEEPNNTNNHKNLRIDADISNETPENKSQYDTFANFEHHINCNFANFKQYLHNSDENRLINFNIMEQRVSMNELKIKDFENRFCTDFTNNQYNGLSYIVYAGSDIEKNDIVEIYYENNTVFVRPVSPNNNNFYGIALQSAVTGSKVQVLTNGICRVKLYNNITLPLMKCINGKLIMLRDQKNNIVYKQLPININTGDILITMKNNDDLIAGPNSMYSQFNNIKGTYMIPYKNILFNNFSSLYSLTDNTKTSVGLRFVHVLDSQIIDNTILVRI